MTTTMMMMMINNNNTIVDKNWTHSEYFFLVSEFRQENTLTSSCPFHNLMKEFQVIFAFSILIIIIIIIIITTIITTIKYNKCCALIHILRELSYSLAS